jgi:hypothetical protein
MKFRGNELAPWTQIARRLVAYPFLLVLRILLYIVVLFGWGKHVADSVLDATR